MIDDDMITVTIQHHPKRVKHLDLLLHALDVDIVNEFMVVEDEVNSASGMKKCFEAVKRPGHVIVLQDDILPCQDLLATCRLLIDRHPDEFISLYSDNPAISQAVEQGFHWVKTNVAHGLCAYILPTWLINSYLELEPSIRQVYADDVMLSIFLKHASIPIWLTAPSLVEHIGHETAQGFKHLKTRMANYFIGYEHSGLEINWHEYGYLPITVASDTRKLIDE